VISQKRSWITGSENSGGFIKVMPVEYKKALKLIEDEKMRTAEMELKTA
jgi:glutamate synthase (NADPH) large chain